MEEVRCVFRANYKSPGIGFYDFGRFEQWFPVQEAIRLMNDQEARARLFRMHYPSCVAIDRNYVTMEIHESRK
jgi:hypothetical protein